MILGNILNHEQAGGSFLFLYSYCQPVSKINFNYRGDNNMNEFVNGLLDDFEMSEKEYVNSYCFSGYQLSVYQVPTKSIRTKTTITQNNY